MLGVCEKATAVNDEVVAVPRVLVAMTASYLRASR
jgi:hypothetical protein